MRVAPVIDFNSDLMEIYFVFIGCVYCIQYSMELPIERQSKFNSIQFNCFKIQLHKNDSIYFMNVCVGESGWSQFKLTDRLYVFASLFFTIPFFPIINKHFCEVVLLLFMFSFVKICSVWFRFFFLQWKTIKNIFQTYPL